MIKPIFKTATTVNRARTLCTTVARCFRREWCDRGGAERVERSVEDAELARGRSDGAPPAAAHHPRRQGRDGQQQLRGVLFSLCFSHSTPMLPYMSHSHPSLYITHRRVLYRPSRSLASSASVRLSSSSQRSTSGGGSTAGGSGWSRRRARRRARWRPRWRGLPSRVRSRLAAPPPAAPPPTVEGKRLEVEPTRMGMTEP